MNYTMDEVNPEIFSIICKYTGYNRDIFSWYFSFPTAFSLALGSLYMDHIKMDDTDVVGVLAAASLLEFRELKRT